VSHSNNILAVLGAIALSAVIAPDDAEAHYQSQCDWLSQQAPRQLEQFIRENPDHACAEVAALLLVERTLPAAEGRSSAAGGRY
jgi:hypothetical protein